MNNRGMEITVGAFILIGLMAAAALVLKFSQNTSASYKDFVFSVAFPSADGILRESRVKMAGVFIGRVVSEPRINEKGDRAIIDIGLAPSVRVRSGSQFVIREQGLLGDRYIEVLPNPDLGVPPIQKGDKVEGRRTSGLGDLTDDARPVVLKAKDALDQINSILNKLDGEVLTSDTQVDIKQSLAKLNSILTKIDNDMLSDSACADYAGSMKKMHSSLERLDRILAQAEKGDGVLGKLLSDKAMANDLRAFVLNLRQRGILWYRDSPDTKTQKK